MSPSTSTSASTTAEMAREIQRLLKEDLPNSTGSRQADAVRLDELRKIFTMLVRHEKRSWNPTMSSSSSSSSSGVTTTTTSDNNCSSETRQQWNAFLTRSFDMLVDQLSNRIREHGSRTAVRTFWGILAGCPVYTTTSSNNNNDGKEFYPRVSTQLLQQFIQATTSTKSTTSSLLDDSTVRRMLQDEFLKPYTDIQYYTMMSIASICSNLAAADAKNQRVQQQSERLLEILCMIPIPSSQADLNDNNNAGYLFPPPPPGEEEEETSSLESEDDDDDDDDDDSEQDSDSNVSSDDDDDDELQQPSKKKVKRDAVVDDKKKLCSFQKAKCHYRAWSKAWLALLRLPQLPLASLKKALHFLPSHVLPHVPNPLLFADFFMSAYNYKSNDSDSSSSSSTAAASASAASSAVVPLLALDGLFLLMTQHGLEYADFYKQLYRLVTPRLLYFKHRSRFFHLLERCLCKNYMLPAHIVAAFCKRLVRCAVTSAPPGGSLYVLALVSNLLRLHPEISGLVHRRHDNNADEGWKDGFNAETDDPEQANALQSSLHELNALERHYFGSAVGTLAHSIGREESRHEEPLHALQDFSAHTYRSLFEQERKRRVRNNNSSGNNKQKHSNNKTPVTFVKPTSLFTETDVFAGILNTTTTTTTTGTTSNAAARVVEKDEEGVEA